MVDHGTLTRHKNYGCRCDPCIAAYRAYEAEHQTTWRPPPGPRLPYSDAWSLPSVREPMDWTGAACQGESTDLFFPRRGDDNSRALAICARCPIRQQCLDYALDNGEHWGIFGGATEATRRRMRRRRAS